MDRRGCTRRDLLPGAAVVPQHLPASLRACPAALLLTPRAAKSPCALSNCPRWSDCKQPRVPQSCLRQESQAGRALTLPQVWARPGELGSSPGTAVGLSHHSAVGKGGCAAPALRKGKLRHGAGLSLLHCRPSLKTFFSPGSGSSTLWAHALCKYITALLLSGTLAGPRGQLLGGSVWEGGVRLARGALRCSARGAARGSSFPRELESWRELAAGPAAQLPQRLQAGRPSAQAILASDSAHQIETGQWVTSGFALAPETVALATGMGTAGGWGLQMGAKAPLAVTRHRDPSSACAAGIRLHRALRACVVCARAHVFHGGLVPRGALAARKRVGSRLPSLSTSQA